MPGEKPASDWGGNGPGESFRQFNEPLPLEQISITRYSARFPRRAAGEEWNCQTYEEPTVYAIIEDSGSQLKVSEGDIVEIDPRERDDKDTIVFDRVLAIGEGEGAARLGHPYLAGAKVTAELLDEILGEKLHVIKYKRRKGYRRKIGHRQQYLRVKISSIEG